MLQFKLTGFWGFGVLGFWGQSLQINYWFCINSSKVLKAGRTEVLVNAWKLSVGKRQRFCLCFLRFVLLDKNVTKKNTDSSFIRGFGVLGFWG